MEIYVNTIIEYRDEELKTKSLERVLWISSDLKTVVVIRIDNQDKPLFPVFKGYHEIIDLLKTPYAIKLKDDPFFELNFPGEDYLKKHKHKRDEKWKIVEKYVEYEPHIYEPQRLKEIVEQIKKETGKRSKRVYSIFREYWIGGKTKNALLPNYFNSGGKGKEKVLKDKKIGRPSKKSIVLGPESEGVNVTEADKKIFEIAITKFYKGNKTTLQNVYNEMRASFYISGYKMVNDKLVGILLPDEQVPNYRQFLFWYNKTYNFKDRLINRIGERQYYLTGRPIVGSATNKTSGPGDIFEIDATIADIYLVSEIDRSRIIGRPIIYIVKDVYSRMVTGVYVGLEGPSWIAAMMAMENTATNKKEYCKRIGIDIEEEDWPCNHLPKKIKADRGEFESKNADKLVDSFGIQIINAPPYRADLKGIVERHFRILNDRIKLHWVPGIVHKDFNARGGRDYRLDAKLTLKAFEQIIVLTILEHNKKVINGYSLEKEMIQDNITPTPINIWKWGIRHRSGLLKQVSRDEIRINLMPSKKAYVTGEGVAFNNMRYSSEEAIQSGWFEEARKGRWSVIAHYDPRDVEHIYIDNKKFRLVDEDKRFASFRIEEIQEQQLVMETQISELKTKERQRTIDTDVEIKNIIEIETKSTNDAQIKEQSISGKLRGISENRKIEKSFQRNKEKWDDTFEKNKGKTNGQVVNLKDFKNHGDTVDDGDYLLNLIINNDNEEKKNEN